MESLYLKCLGGRRLKVIPGLDAKRVRICILAALDESVKRCHKAVRRCVKDASVARVRRARKEVRRLLAAVELVELLGFVRRPKRLGRVLGKPIRALGKVRDRDMLRELIEKEMAGEAVPPAAASVAKRLDGKLRRQRRRAAQRAVRRLQALDLKPICDCFAGLRHRAIAPAAVNRALAKAFAEAKRERPLPGRDPHRSRKALTRYQERLRPLHDVLPPDRVDELRPRVVAALGILHDEEVLLSKWQKWVAKKPRRIEAASPLTALLEDARAKASREVKSFSGFARRGASKTSKG